MIRFSLTGIKSQPVEQSSYEVSMLHDCLPPAASSRTSLQGNTAQPQLALIRCQNVSNVICLGLDPAWARQDCSRLTLYNNASD